MRQDLWDTLRLSFGSFRPAHQQGSSDSDAQDHSKGAIRIDKPSPQKVQSIQDEQGDPCDC